MTLNKSLCAYLGIIVLIVSLNLTGAAAHAEGAPSFKKIFVVVFENTGSSLTFKQPFFKKISEQGAVLQNYNAIGHPSLPNYIALSGGDTFGIVDDRLRNLDKSNLADLLEAKGRSWRIYAEDYPGGKNRCFKSAVHRFYCRRHTPFLNYKNILDNPERCANVVNATELGADIENDRLADFTFFIPNNLNNGHDTGVAFADRWFKNTFDARLSDRRFSKDMLFVVTFDEDDEAHHNSVYTVLWGDSVLPGSKSSVHYTHYSLLRFIEDAFGLGTLGRRDASDRGELIRDSAVWRK